MMPKEDRDKIIQKYHDLYRKIGKVTCPAFPGQFIYFNKHGWKHLIYKERKSRNFSDQMRRFRLLPIAVYILKEENHRVSFRKLQSGQNITQFWKITSKDISIIIRKVDNGNLHFFSIF